MMISESTWSHAGRGLLLLVPFLAGCFDDPTSLHRPTVLDERLATALQEADPQGMAAFLLPASDDLTRIPQDPKNPLTPQKVELGKLLLHETALATGNVREVGRESYSCGSCHVAAAGFGPGLPQGIAEGGTGFGSAGEGRSMWREEYDDAEADVQPIRPPSLLNGAYQTLKLWDGRLGGVGENLEHRDRWQDGTPTESNHLGLHGLETQGHAGLRVHRMEAVAESRIAEIPAYRELFAAAFPGDPEPITRYNAALAIAAYQRTLVADRSPWQRWLRGEADALTDQEKRGAILFFGEAGCVTCHTGPALASTTFHALGMPDLDASADPGRVNLAPFDGRVPDEVSRGRGGFTGDPADDYRFKTPQLYNLADQSFLGHGSSFTSVRQVVEYKNAGVPARQVPNLSPLFRPLELSAQEVDQLTAFLERGLRDPDLERYLPREMPSGNCPGVNDPRAREEKGC